MTANNTTRLPSLQEEMGKMAEKYGFYISPYQLNEMLRIAAKMMNVMVSGSFQPTHEECQMILAIIQNALGLGCPEFQEGNEHG